MTHATALHHNGKWIDFEFIPTDNPLEVAMRHVRPEYRDVIRPVVLASYTDTEFDALMSTPLYTALMSVMDNPEAMQQLGTGIGFDDFVNTHYPQH